MANNIDNNNNGVIDNLLRQLQKKLLINGNINDSSSNERGLDEKDNSNVKIIIKSKNKNSNNNNNNSSMNNSKNNNNSNFPFLNTINVIKQPLQHQH